MKLPFNIIKFPYHIMFVSKKEHWPEGGGFAFKTWVVYRPLKLLGYFLMEAFRCLK